jgi:hypothetical protein
MSFRIDQLAVLNLVTVGNSVTAGSFVRSGGTAVQFLMADGSVSTNPGWLTSITSNQVTTALGYTPYNATNPNGYTSNTGTVTSVSGTGTVSGLTLTGTVTSSGSLTLGGTLSASIDNITDEHRLFNNMGDNHGTRSSFDATTPSYNFGWRYVQGNTNGPGVNSATQYYSVYVGLGNDYPATGAGSYGMQLAIPRNVTTPYISVRYNENNGLGSWQKIAAGYADTAGALTSMNISQFTNNSGYTTNVGTVTSVSGTGTVSGLTLSGTVTSSGSLTLGGTLTLTSGQVTGALGYTPYNSSNPNGYITSSGSISGSAGSVAWTNVTGRPSALSSFTNDIVARTTLSASGDFQFGGQDLAQNNFSLSGATTDTDQFGRYYYSGTSGSIWSRYLPVDKTGRYRMRLRWKATASNSTYLAVILLDTNGNNINGAGTYWAYPWSGSGAPTSWTTSEYWYDGSSFPSNAAYVAFGISHTNYGGGSATYYVSQLELERYNDKIAGNTVWHAGNLTNLNQLSNGPGYITGYTETDTLATVTGRGASTSTNSIFTGGLQARRNQSDNNYTTAALWTESYGGTTTGIAFHISGNVGKFLEMRTNGVLYWENGQVWTSSNLTNLNQLSNGPGYITASYGGFATRQDGTRFTTNYNSILSSGFFNAEGQPSNAPNSYGQLIVAKGSDTGLQIAGGYNSNNLYFRGWGYGPEADGFYPWRTVWHNGNLTNLNQLTNGPGYITSSSLGAYLPLAGGTMTGNIGWGQTDRGLTWDFNTDGAYIKFFNTGNGDTDSRLEYGTYDDGNEYHRFIVSNVERFTIKADGARVSGNLVWHAGNLTNLNQLSNGPGYITSAANWFGAVTTGGTTDWNHVTNTRPGTGYTLLLGSHSNGPGSGEYYHSLNLEYSSKDGTGNVTQMAISYGSPGNKLYMRGRYDGSWSGWNQFVTNSGTWGINVTGTSGSISGFNNPTTSATANTIAYRDAQGDITVRELVMNVGVQNFTPSSMVAIYPTTNQAVKVTASGAREFLNVPTRTGGDASGTWGINISGIAARATRANGNFYIDDNYGNTIVGVYASTRYQGVFAMGDSYKLPGDGTSTGSLYGLAWSHPNAGGVAGNLNTHGLLVMENGTFLAAISGSIRARDDMRAPIFYDSNNTGYYLDPNSTSYLYYIQMPHLGNGTPNIRVNDNAAENWRAIQVGNGNMGIGISGSSRSWSGRVSMAFHVGVSESFRVHSDGWDSLFEVWGSTGYARTKGSLEVGGDVYLGTRGNWMTTLLDAKASTGHLHDDRYFFDYGFTTGYPGTEANGMPGNRSAFTYSNGAPLTGCIAHFGASGYGIQLNGDYGGDSFSMRSRNGDNATWRPWKRLLTDYNYNNYSPTLTGGNASGTWGISITGSASSATFLNNSNYINRCGSSGNANTDFQNTPAGSVRHNGDDANLSNSPGGTWWFYDNYRHSNGSNFWGTQVAWGWEDNANRLATRNISGGNFGGWVYYLNSSNFSNWAVPIGGGYLDNIFYFRTNLGGYCGSLSNARMQAYSDSNNSAFISFHKGSQYAVNLGLDADNVMRIGGWSASSNRWQLDMSGNMTVAGDVTAYSDARVKENVVTVEDALDRVQKMRGVFYNRTDSDDKKRKVGVIAQEIMEVLPEVVNQDNEGMYNVSYGNVVGVLIEAIKEQQSQIEDLKNQITELKENK